MPPSPDPATRRAVFQALVEAADRTRQLGPARALVAALYRLPVEEVTAIEREGVEKDWRPG